MLQSQAMQELDGVVFGRTDMTGSLGMSKDDINHPDILAYAQKIAALTTQYKKEFIIGGGVSAQSLPFFQQLPKGALHRFETRKVIFDAPAMLQDHEAYKGILKAVGFEVLWIKNKQQFYKSISIEDNKRLEVLQSRYEKSIKQAGGLC